MSPQPQIRRHLRPGDLGTIVAHHGRMYAREYGLDHSFEAGVAASVGRAASRGFPGPREGIWIVELDGEHAGSIGLTDEGEGLGIVRWVLLAPQLRGAGLGRRLISAVIETAERAGQSRLALETFSELTAAAHLYRSHGFELLWEQTGPRWGRPEITYQRYELVLPRAGRTAATASSPIADPATR